MQAGVRAQSHVEHLLHLLADRKQCRDCLHTLLSLSADNPRLGHELIRKNGLQVLGLQLPESLASDVEVAALVLKVLNAVINSEELAQLAMEFVSSSSDCFDSSTNKLRWEYLCGLIQFPSEDISSLALKLCLKIFTLLPISPLQYSDDMFASEEYNDSKKYNEALLSTFHPSKLFLQPCHVKPLLHGIQHVLSLNSYTSTQLGISALSSLFATTSEGVEGRLPEYFDLRNESLSHRKRRNYYERWLTVRATQTAACFIEEGGIGKLLDCMDHPSSEIRRMVSKCFGAMVTVYNNQELMKSLLSIYVTEDEKLEDCFRRALLESCLCLTHPDLCIWAIEQQEGVKQLIKLVLCGHPLYQEVVSELIYLLSSSEKSSSILSPIAAPGGILYTLLQSSSPTVRSNAASTITKLGIKSKALKESSSDTSRILNVSLDIVKAHVTQTPVSEVRLEQGLVSFSAFDNVSESKQTKTTEKDVFIADLAAVERAIEVIASLANQTTIKEELVHGSYRVAKTLRYVFALPLTEEMYQSTLAYGIAQIISSLSITNNELHQAQLSEKGITLEQYKEMIELQRIKARDGDGSTYEEEKEIEDTDTQIMCKERIRKIVEMKAVPLLVKILESKLSTSQTKLCCATALKQICVDESVRGKVILEGGLKVAILSALNKSFEPGVRRQCAHAVAKILVTTNSNVLPSHTRLDAIKPLIQMCNEDSYSELEHFEALLALTNLSSLGEAEQNSLAANKGIKVVFFLMLSENDMVRRAAVELICNMSGHRAVVEFFMKREYLRALIGFCGSWASDLDDSVDATSSPLPMNNEAYKTARAAAGALATLAADASICSTLIQEKILTSTISLLGSAKYEFLHRGLAILQNLIENSAKDVANAGEEQLGEHYVEGVSCPKLLQAVVTAALTSVKSMSQRDANMIAMLEGLASQIMTILRKIS